MKIRGVDVTLMTEVRANPVAYELLRNKCVWEAMSNYAVLRIWGDPRTWPSYAELLTQGEGKAGR